MLMTHFPSELLTIKASEYTFNIIITITSNAAQLS